MEKLSIVLLVALMLAGCSHVEDNKDYKAPLEIATEQSEYIMECIVNKDKEGLKSIFSKHVAETHDLDEEIDECTAQKIRRKLDNEIERYMPKEIIFPSLPQLVR